MWSLFGSGKAARLTESRYAAKLSAKNLLEFHPSNLEVDFTSRNKVGSTKYHSHEESVDCPMASDSSMCHKASVVAYTSDWGSVFQDGGLENKKYIYRGSGVRRLVPPKI